MKYRLSLVAWLAFLLLGGATGAGANTVPTEAAPMPFIGNATYGLTRLAQAAPAAAPADAQPADDEPIGNVATLTGTATVTRNNTPTPLKLQDDIFLNDVLQTSANSTLGVTFNDATTFNLTATTMSMKTAASRTPRCSISPKARSRSSRRRSPIAAT
jgi:hypothetical protein